MFFYSSRRRHTRLQGDWSSDVCSSDLDRESDRGLHPLPAALRENRGDGEADHEQRRLERGRHRAAEDQSDDEQVALANRSEERRVGKEVGYGRLAKRDKSKRSREMKRD